MFGQRLAGLYGVIAGFHEMGGRSLRTVENLEVIRVAAQMRCRSINPRLVAAVGAVCIQRRQRAD